MNTLSPEELQTHEAYKIIAQSRNNTQANPEFWNAEFEHSKVFFRQGESLMLDVGLVAMHCFLPMKDTNM